MINYTIEKEIDGEYFNIEIDIEDVLEFIEHGTSSKEREEIMEIFKDEMRDEIREEIENDLRSEIKEENITELKKQYNIEIETVIDKMKMKLLSQAMKNYSLEELEEKLGTEFELGTGIKKK